MKKRSVLLGILCLVMTGCMTAEQHRAAVRNDAGDRLSIAKVQREIRVGMSGAEVVSILGSPNMVTTDSERRETWVYDKVATERAYSSSSGGLFLILGGVGSEAGASSSNQRTITIIIKFNKDNTVRDYSYRQSSF
ncbi:MAG: outer membrane protein assembly factor BamE [bacterium]|nr:outer membrane protein assembly factor BamE [bacterium]